MAYTTAEGREQIFDALAAAAAEIAFALVSMGAAYEQLDDSTAGRLEEELFRPVQAAYAAVRRKHAAFAERCGLAGEQGPDSASQPRSPGAPAGGVRGFVDGAVEAVARADGALAALQDSMMPVEVGDAELRAGIVQVRELLGGVRGRARELLRTLGR
jgi:hypothetical protein